MIPFIPDNYRLVIEPDLAQFTFSGHATIEYTATTPVDSVELHALDLAIGSSNVAVNGIRKTCKMTSVKENESIRLVFPEPVEGRFSVEIIYTGPIGNGMAGLYRSGYRNEKGGLKHIAVTQFQESDARRAFPCVDVPGAKATFDIEIVIDSTLVAVSNEEIVSEESAGGGKKRVRFKRTPKMSTYLVFFGIGDFVTGAPGPGSERVRAVTLPHHAPYTAYGTDFGEKTLSFCEEYYGIPYPLAKLDLIAVPDFAFGAMENWGAITFRENLLLHYPDATSRSGEFRICEVVAHEIAHQWFGNLVTPADWKYLWLNESFATYFAYGVVDHYHPDWETWSHFIQGQTLSALNRDSLTDTVAIEIPGGEHVVINSSTAPIIYSKGGSILRQIEGYIGSENFQKGLRKYLAEFSYECAESHHLWKALEAASDQPVTDIMKSWIEQPGHPIITVVKQDGHLQFRQHRFTHLANASEQTWEVPLSVRFFDADGGQTVQTILLKDTETTLPVADNVSAYKINDRQTGFYRVRYADDDNIQRLGRYGKEGVLSPEDRWGLQNDLFALVKSGEVTLAAYLDFLDVYYEKEQAFLPLSGIADNLFFSYLLTEGELRRRVAATGIGFVENILQTVGAEPNDTDSHSTAALRDSAIWHGVVYGSSMAAETATTHFAALMNGQRIHPDMMKCVLQAGAWAGEEETLEWMFRRFDHSESEHERMNILTALGSFREPALIEKVRDFVLNSVPDRNRFVTISALCANPAAAGGMWDWYISQLERLEQSHPLLYERIISSVVAFAGIFSPAEVRSFFAEYVKRKPECEDVARLSLERLEIHLKLRSS